jgi:hypothetical protein
MTEIKLNKSEVAFVDDDMANEINKNKWAILKGGKDKSYVYAVRRKRVGGKREHILMHRQIMGLKKGDNFDIDHINHNGLDNRKCNLRVCSRSQNQHNRKSSINSSSIYKGVSWDKDRSMWRATIADNSTDFQLGRYLTEIEAAEAYNRKAIELFGEFAFLNNLPKKGS